MVWHLVSCVWEAVLVCTVLLLLLHPRAVGLRRGDGLPRSQSVRPAAGFHHDNTYFLHQQHNHELTHCHASNSTVLDTCDASRDASLTAARVLTARSTGATPLPARITPTVLQQGMHRDMRL